MAAWRSKHLLRARNEVFELNFASDDVSGEWEGIQKQRRHHDHCQASRKDDAFCRSADESAQYDVLLGKDQALLQECRSQSRAAVKTDEQDLETILDDWQLHENIQNDWEERGKFLFICLTFLYRKMRLKISKNKTA
jgi:hypothetical protein